MATVTTIGLDLAKRYFQVHGVDKMVDRHRVFLDTNLGDYRGRQGGV